MTIITLSSASGTNSVFTAIENLSLTSSSSSTTTTTSSSVIQQVVGNFDLLTHILLCLPVKSLLVFKSVSKQWLSLISDPSFAINHFRRHHRISKIHGFFFEKCTQPPHTYLYDFLLLDGSRIEEEETLKDPYFRQPGDDYDDDDEDETAGCIIPFKTLNFGKCPTGYIGWAIENGVRINQSCNGLLCCTRETEIRNPNDEPHIFITHTYIYNPTTRQYKALPPSPFRDCDGGVRDDGCCFKVCSMSLVFDPIKSPDHHYQVICIFKDDEICRYYYIEIYSSKTNSWKKLISSSVNPFYALDNSFNKSGVYWNGSLHWIKTFKDFLHESSMYFDIEQELVKPLPLPTMAINDYEWDCVYFGECGGHLYLIEVLKSCYTNYNILKMENDYSGWNLIYKLDLERFIAAYPVIDIVTFHNIRMLYRMVLFLEEDEEEEEESLSKLVWIVGSGKIVISHDLKEMSITEIHTFTKGIGWSLVDTGGLLGYVHHYIESLACV